MFKPDKVWKASLIIPESFEKELIKKLENERIIQIKESPKILKDFTQVDNYSVSTEEYVQLLVELDYLIETHNFSGQEKVLYPDLLKKGRELVNKVKEDFEKIRSEKKELSSVMKESEDYVYVLDSIRTILVNIEEDKKLLLFDSPEDMESFKQDFRKKFSESIIFVNELETRVVVTVITEKSEKVKNYLDKKKISFYSGVLNELYSKLKKKIDEINKKLEKLDEKKKTIINKYGKKIIFIKNSVSSRIDVLEEKKKFYKTDYTTIFSFWIPDSNFNKLLKILKKVTGESYLLFREEAEPEEAPVLLKNSPILQPFEKFLEDYGLPRMNEVDPTPIISLVFPLFFGIMLSDAGYGLLLLIVSVFFILKEQNKRFAIILLYCAFSTIIMGVLFGSFFGIQFIKPRINLLKQPIRVMVLSMIVGVLYVNLGIIIGIVQDIIKKDYKKLLFNHLSWLLLEAGIIMYFYEPLKWMTLPIFIISIISLISGTGLLGLLDIPQFISTFISFIRLSALALATAWISFTVNLLFNIVNQIPYGIIIGLIIFVVGHVFNFAFNAFGAFLQAMRLHYIEFLGQFYEGKGKKIDYFGGEK